MSREYGNNVVLKTRNIDRLTFSNESDVFRPDISVAVELEDVGLSFTVFFKKNHLDIVSFRGRYSQGILNNVLACTLAVCTVVFVCNMSTV